MRFTSFQEMLSHWAGIRPDAAALLYDGKQLSYAELCGEIAWRAEALRAEGKTCLGLLADGSLDCVLELFAAVAAGQQLVLLDENTDEALLRQLIVYTDIDCLWGDEELCEELAPCLTASVKDGAGKLLFFTSGTTERAKAVVLTEQSFCASA